MLKKVSTRRIFASLLLLIVLLSACSPAVSQSPTATFQQAPTVDASRLVEERVTTLLAQMTLAEKIGQMTQVEKNSIRPGDIAKYFIGSILSGGGGSPLTNTAKSWADMVDGFQKEALATRLKIPIIYG
ncbi:MAG TPA: hypothetical protein VF359_05410, partial [Anaerolineales bacterium]